jgi:hypothetical protein
MDDPLRSNFLFLLSLARIGKPEFAYDVLASPMDSEDRPAHQPVGLTRRWCLERLAMAAEKDFYDPIAAHARIHTASDGFHLR